jgi:hypothetical protein
MCPRSIANIKDANYHSNYLQNKHKTTKTAATQHNGAAQKKKLPSLDFQRSALKSHDD